MRLLQWTSLLQICVLFICSCLSDGLRLKRQIIFEDDDDLGDRSDLECVTLSQVRGICIPVTTCPRMSRITNWNRLQPYICGFEGSEPKVCCPDSLDTRIIEEPRSTRRTTTRRPTPSRRTTPRRTTPGRTTPRRTTPSTTTTTTNRPGFRKPIFLPDQCGVSNATDVRVVGGREAEPGSWPWMAVVFVEKRNGRMSPDCGGALVTSRHIVTAAHCIVAGRAAVTMSPRQLSVRLGAHDLRNENEPTTVDVGVDAVRRHERFDPRTYRNDIAVLRLNRPVNFTPRISPICLPYDSLRDEDIAGRKGTVIGFGTTAFNGPSSDVLMQATFDIMPEDVCKRAYEREVNISSVYMCAGVDTGEKDSCQGDSGGPLMSVGRGGNYYLVGVVSFGKLCGQPGYPGVYTRITEFLDWLEENLSD